MFKCSVLHCLVFIYLNGFIVLLLKTFTGCVVNLILSYMKKIRMFINITKVFIKKCQVDVYTKEGIFISFCKCDFQI